MTRDHTQALLHITFILVRMLTREYDFKFLGNHHFSYDFLLCLLVIFSRKKNLVALSWVALQFVTWACDSLTCQMFSPPLSCQSLLLFLHNETSNMLFILHVSKDRGKQTQRAVKDNLQPILAFNQLSNPSFLSS